MALQKTDKKQKMSVSGFFNKNLGHDSYGQTLPAHTIAGAFHSIALFQRKEFTVAASICTVVFGGLFGAGYAEYCLDKTIDLEVPHVQQANENFGYILTHGSGENKITRNYALYDQGGTYTLLRNNDDIPQDDIMYPYTRAVNSASIAAEVLTHLYNLEANGTDNPGFVVSYEGFSPVYSDTDSPEVTYVIGDNVETAAPLTSEQLQEQIATWQAALDDFTHGEVGALTPELQGQHRYENYNMFKIYGAMFAALTGLGAVVGTGSGIAASRRRYNKENEFKRP